jgi:hypothetical protein
MLTTAFALAFMSAMTGGGPGDELGTAINKTFANKSYAFELKVSREGGRGGPEWPAITGEVAADAPVHFVAGELQAYKEGEKIVYQEQGKWKLMERAAWEGGGGGRGAAGGGGGGGAGGGGGEQGREGGGGGRGQGGGFSPAMMLRGVQTPHTILQGIEKKLEGITVSEEKGSRVFSGKLTADAAKELAGRLMRGRGGEGEPTVTGDAKFWVDASGQLQKYEVTTVVGGPGGREFKTTRLVTLKSGADSKVVVPEEVKQLLSKDAGESKGEGEKKSD